MATTNLGKVSVTPKGEYDPLITYERLDIINHNGSSYIVKQTSIGVTPIEGEFYALIAEKGDGGSFVKKAYKTYAAMDADKVNIPANSSVDVTNDLDESKNGAYIYDGVAFTRSQYDSKVVTDKIIADTAIAVQDAINNTAVEGGVLAATFLTTEEQFDGKGAINQREHNLNTVYSVSGLLDLLSLKHTAKLSSSLRSFYKDKGKGGGIFVWDSTADKSTANGATIIDPTKKGGFDGTYNTLATYFADQGTGVGLGCWVRTDDRISQFGFGAVGDGTQDDSLALQKYLDFSKGESEVGEHLINTTLRVGDSFDLSKAKLMLSEGFSGFALEITPDISLKDLPYLYRIISKTFKTPEITDLSNINEAGDFTADTKGILAHNVYSCKFILSGQTSTRLKTGFVVRATDNTGACYNTFENLHISACEKGLRFECESDGWIADNLFEKLRITYPNARSDLNYTGRWAISSTTDRYAVENNTFASATLEHNGRLEYDVHVENGRFTRNTFLAPRLENPSAVYNVHLNPLANPPAEYRFNNIYGGNSVGNLNMISDQSMFGNEMIKGIDAPFIAGGDATTNKAGFYLLERNGKAKFPATVNELSSDGDYYDMTLNYLGLQMKDASLLEMKTRLAAGSLSLRYRAGVDKTWVKMSVNVGNRLVIEGSGGITTNTKLQAVLGDASTPFKSLSTGTIGLYAEKHDKTATSEMTLTPVYDGNRLILGGVANLIGSDATLSIGRADRTIKDIFLENAPVVTSDSTYKEGIRSLSDAELAVATKCKELVRAYKLKSSVEAKGDAARIHIGFIAQDIEAAFENEGLDAFDYSILCYDEWDADESGTAAGSKYAIRYEELICFIISAL